MSRAVQSHQEAIRSVQRLGRILEAAKLLNSTLDLSELTTIVLKLVREEVGVDRGTVFVVDRDRTLLHAIVAQDVSDHEITLPMGRGIAGAVAATGEIIDILDAYSDPRFDSRFDPIIGYRTNDLYCMPITNRNGVIVGVLELLNRTRPLVREDLEFLAGISVHVGLAVENAWLHREILEKKRIEQELVLAREIQQHFYPRLPGSYGGVEIAASSIMCETVGGDYLDYFPLPDGRFIIMLGDVSGKGIGAALVMTSLHSTCRALLRHVHALERIAFILNETLVETTGAQTFATMIMVLVDPVERKLHCIRAGHNPPLCIGPSGIATTLDQGGGPPIGMFRRVAYKREICEVEAGSAVVIFTDGVSEAENASGERYGVERLSGFISSCFGASAEEIHSRIRSSLKTFTLHQPPNDDSTLIVLKF